MSLYLVTDAETGTAVLIEAKRSDGAISIAVANRFVASAVTVREAFDLGQRGVKLIDPEADEADPDLPRFLQQNSKASLPPVEGAAEQGEAESNNPAAASPEAHTASNEVDSEIDQASDARPEERPSSPNADVTAGETTTPKSLFERMSNIARGEAPAHEDAEEKADV